MIKAGIFLLAIIIVGVVSIMLLDPGSDLYNNYNSLYSSSKIVNSKSKFTKEYNYVLEGGANEKDNSDSINQGAVVYLNQSKGGQPNEVGGWAGSNEIPGKPNGTICIACSGCGPTSLAEFELQQGKILELANPEKMMIYGWDNGLMANQKQGTSCKHGVSQRQATAGYTNAVKKYATEKGYSYEVLPKECWGDSSKTRDWFIGHLKDGHWVMNLLGVGKGANGHNSTDDPKMNRVFQNSGHFVSFFGLSADGDPITYDVGAIAHNGLAVKWDDIWYDSRPINGSDERAHFMTAIWNEDVTSVNTGSGSNSGGSVVTADGELKLKETMKFADRVWSKTTFQDMTCYAFKSTATTKKNFTVFIDAGHGSDVLGLSSKDEYLFPTANDGVGGTIVKGEGFQLRGTGESEFNIDIGLKVKDLLLAEGYDVVMSRIGADRKISNGAVGIMASETSDILISIHWNGSPTPGSASGTISFYLDRTAVSAAGYNYSKMPSEWGSNDQMARSKELAEMMTSSIVDGTELERNGSGIRSEYERVLGYSTIPSILVETGFGDHSGDRVILNGKKDDTAKSYVDGVNKYYNKYK